jgi:hypothetical protein
VPDPTIRIDRIAAESMRVPILGTSPLILHRFPEKAKREMLDKMQGRRTPKQHRDPQADFEAASYRFEDGGYGVPVIAFKRATVSASRFYGGQLKMTELRQFLFFHGELGVDGQELARLDHEPKMREDVVRLTGRTADLRYRPEWAEWATTLDVTFVSNILARESVLSLIDAGGMGVGVGEWRPEKNGTNGTFRIDPDREVEVIEVKR